MLEDEYFNLFEQNIYAVRKLKRMSRQDLDKLREIKIVDFLWEKNNEND